MQNNIIFCPLHCVMLNLLIFTLSIFSAELDGKIEKNDNYKYCLFFISDQGVPGLVDFKNKAAIDNISMAVNSGKNFINDMFKETPFADVSGWGIKRICIEECLLKKNTSKCKLIVIDYEFNLNKIGSGGYPFQITIPFEMSGKMLDYTIDKISCDNLFYLFTDIMDLGEIKRRFGNASVNDRIGKPQ